jgi:hypothetical protein
MKFYALMHNNNVFTCQAKTKEQHLRLVEKAYSNWRGLQSKGSDPTMADFIVRSKATHVLVTVEYVDD